MSGVLNVLAAGGGKFVYSVTVGSFAGPSYGFNNSAGAGAISPATFRGLTVLDVDSRSGNNDFNLTLSTVVAQTYFQYVMVQRTDGAWTIYHQADAFFTGGPINTLWTWGFGVGGDPAWTATSPSPRAVIIAF